MLACSVRRPDASMANALPEDFAAYALADAAAQDEYIAVTVDVGEGHDPVYDLGASDPDML